MKLVKNTIRNFFRDSRDLLQDITIWIPKPSISNNYDKYENNITKDNFIAYSIKGYISELSPESLKWQEYGLEKAGMKEILCEVKYKDYFIKASRIDINNEYYHVYAKGDGNCLMQTQAGFLLKVITEKVG